MSKAFGGIKQLGFVVLDIEKAMDHWATHLQVGPWFYSENAQTTEFRYYGKPSAFPKLSIALGQCGDLQIELIQQRNDAPSLYLDTLKKNGEIAQHVAFWTMTEFDAHCARLLREGYLEGHAGRLGQNRGRFAYFVHPGLPSAVIEISEGTGGKAEYFEQIRKAADVWDGTTPVRLPSTLQSGTPTRT